MAQRYGGKYSPNAGSGGPPGTSPLAHRRPLWGRTRINLLFLASLPLLLTAFSGGPTKLATHLAAFAAIALGAWLTRAGLDAEDAYNARAVARRPAFPRKIFGGLFMGLGVALATFETSILASGLYGLIAAGLHLTAFGIDPLTNKAIEGVDEFQTDRVARAVDEAEKHLKTMTAAAKRTGDRVLQARVEKFQASARVMFRTIEEDPRDLTAARRYLSVYLTGAKDATIKLADLFERTGRDDDAKASYTALLDDLEQNFTAKTQSFLEDNRTDLDIEIDVLRDRLQREGVRLN